MSKELPFFKFNATQWLTGNINYETYHTQGVFIKACAEYWNRSNDLTIDDLNLRINEAETIKYLIEKDYLKLVLSDLNLLIICTILRFCSDFLNNFIYHKLVL